MLINLGSKYIYIFINKNIFNFQNLLNMSIIISYFLISTYSTWILLVIWKQIFNKKFEFSLKLTKFGFSFFTPIFTLFAPNPVNADYHVYYRILRVSEGIMKSKNSSLVPVKFNKRRTVQNIFWNPNLKTQKLIITKLRSLNTIIKHLKENKHLSKTEYNKRLFYSSSFLSIKKYTHLEMKKNNESIEKGDIVEISIFRSKFIKEDLVITPYLVHKYILKK